MARLIFVIGEHGSGKTRSLKDLDPRETIIIKPNGKPLSFKGYAKKYKLNKNLFIRNEFKQVGALLNTVNKAVKIKNVIIEDLTHFFTKRVIDERKAVGYSKWTELAASFKIHVLDKEIALRSDLNIIVIGHTSRSKFTGKVTLETPGNYLEKSVKVPSYATYMFHTDLLEDEGTGRMVYRFLTNETKHKNAKSPEGVFEDLYIPNNLEYALRHIIAYENGEDDVSLKGIEEKSFKVPQEHSMEGAVFISEDVSDMVNSTIEEEVNTDEEDADVEEDIELSI